MGATRSAPNIVSQRGPRRNISQQDPRRTPPESAPRVPRRSTIPPSKKPERMAGSFSPRPPRREPIVHKDIRPEFGRRKQAKEERDKRMEEERREQNIARTDI